MLFGLLLEILFLIRPYLNPFDGFYFDYHDITQPARLQEFYLNLINFKIPPRVAPNFLFGLSYPVFSFYAPFAYWISSIFMFFGFDAAAAIEASFALALIVAFVASYKFFRLYFSKLSSLLGATVYVTSPYIAVEIFIRGNLGEIWFWALLPAAFYALKERRFLLSFFILHGLFTVHNIFSLLAIPFILGFILLQKEKRALFWVFFLSILSTFYFWLPAFLEMKYVLAKKIAEGTRYFDHFLCFRQLWSSEGWYFGASVPGCKDYMSFKLGKGQVLVGFFGLLVFMLRKRRLKRYREAWYFLLVSLFATFLTLYISQPIWRIFEKFLAVVQFPWRFLLFSLFGLAFFSGFSLEVFRNKILKGGLAIFLIMGLFFVNKKYFFKPLQPKEEFFQKYLSEKAVKEKMVFKIPEYFTVYSDYEIWKKVKKGEVEFEPRLVEGESLKVIEEKVGPFVKRARIEVKKETAIKLGLLYFPYWRIRIDGKEVAPVRFDRFGRPIVSLTKGTKEIVIYYKQTPIEVFATSISIVSLLLVAAYFKGRKG